MTNHVSSMNRRHQLSMYIPFLIGLVIFSLSCSCIDGKWNFSDTVLTTAMPVETPSPSPSCSGQCDPANPSCAQDTICLLTSSDYECCGPVSVVPQCGDGYCANIEGAYPQEDYKTCPEDCGPSCGDGTCDKEAGEDCTTCEQDCGNCCGDSTCDQDAGEDCTTCEQDCGKCCGDGTCSQNAGEDCKTCEEDCQCTPAPTGGGCYAPCDPGNAACHAGLSCIEGGGDGQHICWNQQVCAATSQPACNNNGLCDPGESADCADCQQKPCVCGDGVCEQARCNELIQNCPADCGGGPDPCAGNYCGDGVCRCGESYPTCLDCSP